MADLNSWWAAMETFEKIFWIIALPSTLIFLGILIMTFFGGDVGDDVADADMEIDTDEGIGFQFITFKNLIGFFAIFGWTGIASIKNDSSMSTTLIIAFISGLAMMFIMAGIYYLLSSLVDDGTLKVNNAIGRLGEVYMNIPIKGEGFGKIQITVQGSLRTMEAVTNDKEIIKVGSIVKVKDVIDGHILLVTKSTKY
ncbi:MAG: hypothetical protein DRI54_09100 [Bacteroidetes bacterium]|nr:MAG: hypothetical protein DRI54_09100 [Bacteroidota bacterium]